MSLVVCTLQGDVSGGRGGLGAYESSLEGEFSIGQYFDSHFALAGEAGHIRGYVEASMAVMTVRAQSNIQISKRVTIVHREGDEHLGNQVK
jgi:hypothetical protein